MLQYRPVLSVRADQRRIQPVTGPTVWRHNMVILRKSAGRREEFSNAVLLGMRWSWVLSYYISYFDRKRLDKYELIRQTLRNLSLINEKSHTENCGKEWTESWRCTVLLNTYFCTFQVDYRWHLIFRIKSHKFSIKQNVILPIPYQDPLTGKTKQVMKTPYKKAHRIGGSLPVLKKYI